MEPKNTKKESVPQPKEKGPEKEQSPDSAPSVAAETSQKFTESKEPGQGSQGQKPGPKEQETPSAEELATRLLYLQAEFENYKKRLARDQDQAIRSANERLVRELLPIIDLFDKALITLRRPADKSTQGSELAAGIEMIHRELIQVLKRFGVELVGVEGEAFSPERHEAISQLDAPPEKANTVLSVLRRGCLLNGRLVEPAKVIVAKAKEIVAEEEKA